MLPQVGNYKKYCINYPQAVYIRYIWNKYILFLNLGSVPKHVTMYIQIFQNPKKSEIQNTCGSSISDKGLKCNTDSCKSEERNFVSFVLRESSSSHCHFAALKSCSSFDLLENIPAVPCPSLSSPCALCGQSTHRRDGQRLLPDPCSLCPALWPVNKLTEDRNHTQCPVCLGGRWAEHVSWPVLVAS